LSVLGFSITVPSEKTAKLFKPTSIPTMLAASPLLALSKFVLGLSLISISLVIET